jgi:hypothetical protein
MLALFCMAWLQAAIVPCVMAHTGGLPTQAAAPAGHHEHEASAGHDHHAVPASEDGGEGGHPCLYCPPHGNDGDSGACDGRECAYPHDPQVDARAAGVFFTAVPVAFVLPVPARTVAISRSLSAAPETIPRVSLTVSYCRFIE